MGAVRRGRPESWAVKLAVLLAVPALTGLVIYLLTSAPLLGSNSALLLAWAGLLVFWIDKRVRANVYIAACFLILTTFWLFQAIAQARDWPASQLHEINVISDWLLLPAIACLAIAIVITVRSKRRNRRRSVRT